MKRAAMSDVLGTKNRNDVSMVSIPYGKKTLDYFL
jgi:hypothetical protein